MALPAASSKKQNHARTRVSVTYSTGMPADSDAANANQWGSVMTILTQTWLQAVKPAMIARHGPTPWMMRRMCVPWGDDSCTTYTTPKPLTRTSHNYQAVPSPNTAFIRHNRRSPHKLLQHDLSGCSEQRNSFSGHSSSISSCSHSNRLL
jgi:hypothetical protein